jgi:carbonic anhydrase
MDRALERVRLSESALVVREFGNTLPSRDADDCAETPILDHAVEHFRVREIVICGHSMCSALPTEQREVPLQAPRVNGVDGLLQRMRRREELNDRARDHVIRQLNALESHPSVANAISMGNLTVHGLFYLVESGVFTRYDRESGQFATIAV